MFFYSLFLSILYQNTQQQQHHGDRTRSILWIKKDSHHVIDPLFHAFEVAQNSSVPAFLAPQLWRINIMALFQLTHSFGIKQMPNHWWTSYDYFHDIWSYHSNRTPVKTPLHLALSLLIPFLLWNDNKDVKIQLMAKFKIILYMGFKVTLNFLKFKLTGGVKNVDLLNITHNFFFKIFTIQSLTARKERWFCTFMGLIRTVSIIDWCITHSKVASRRAFVNAK